MRVRVADGPLNAAGTRLPGAELWLIGEWRDSGEKKYDLSNLPKRTTLRRLVATVKARWSCEQVHQQLKQELGLGDFEGRSWTGRHRHALMTCIAFAYLQHRRLKAAGRGKKGGARRTATAAIAARDPPRHHRQAVRSACGSLSLPALPQADFPACF
jgi:SRSO17 transposase